MYCVLASPLTATAEREKKGDKEEEEGRGSHALTIKHHRGGLSLKQDQVEEWWVAGDREGEVFS